MEKAVFSATIPEGDRWKLYYHMPRDVRLDMLGGVEIVVVGDGEDSSSVRISGAEWVRGWNYVGSFDLRSGRVDVVLTDKTEGRFVIADAIMWRKGWL